MKLQTVLSKARTFLDSSIRVINRIIKYLRTWRKRRLYQQWIESGDLSRKDIPQEISQDIVEKIDTEQLRLPTLYVILGASLVILFVGLVILIVHSC